MTGDPWGGSADYIVIPNVGESTTIWKTKTDKFERPFPTELAGSYLFSGP